jgi:hypothetical protein
VAVTVVNVFLFDEHHVLVAAPAVALLRHEVPGTIVCAGFARILFFAWQLLTDLHCPAVHAL